MKLSGSLRRIRTILLKDFRDAVRDARVLFAILTPLAIGVFYNFAFDDEESTPEVTVAITAGTGAEFKSALTTIVEPVVDMTVRNVSDNEIRDLAASSEIDLGILLPADFDTALTSGLDPPIVVVVPEDRSFGGDYVFAAIDPALRTMIGQTIPAEITLEVAAENPDDLSLFDRVGPRTYLVLVSMLLVIAMTGMLAIPIVLAEESEKMTIEALSLIASHREIIIAKAMLGMLYVGIATTLLLALTRLFPTDWPMFIATTISLGITVIGFGLLLAGVLRSASQLNTWSGLVLMPVIAPAFLVGVGLSESVEQIAELFPTGAAMKLFVDSASISSVYDDSVKSYAVILIWGVAAYLLLLWQLSRRRA